MFQKHISPRICMRYIRPQIRRENPLNLSLSISGGKEIKKDFLSSGERKRNSPAFNPQHLLVVEM